MNILVISDLHENLSSAFTLLEEYHSSCDAVLFAGDGISNLETVCSAFDSIKLHAVSGNCDFFTGYPKERLISCGDKKIFLTHGDSYGVKASLNRLHARAKETSADICVFGHTHIPYYKKEDNILFLNPGSLSENREYKNPTYSIICIEEDNVSVLFYDLNTKKQFLPQNY